MASSEGKALWSVLGDVPDQRSRHGLRFELRSVLAMIVAALLSGRSNPAAIARWGRELKPEQLQQFGIDRPRAPCQGTYHYVLKGLCVEALEKALGAWVAPWGAPGQVCLDGKTLRASHSDPYPALHLLALYSERVKGVIAQRPVPAEHNEITVAIELLKEIPLEGMIISGDAEFTQKDICKQVTDGAGDYFLVVKDNQPGLREQIQTAFAAPFSPLGEENVEKGGAHRAQRGSGAWPHGSAPA